MPVELRAVARDRSRDGAKSASCVTGRCVAAIRIACGAGTSAQNWVVETVLDDV